MSYMGGGYAQMIIILHRGGGVSWDPQKWLRNICTTPYMYTGAADSRLERISSPNFDLYKIFFSMETLITNVRFHKSYISPLAVHSQEVN